MVGDRQEGADDGDGIGAGLDHLAGVSCGDPADGDQGKLANRLSNRS